MSQLHLFEPEEVKVDGMTSPDGLFEYWGVAKRQPNGKYQCYANCAGHMCIVEVTITMIEKEKR